MRISTRGRYGLRAMVDIAAHSADNCVTLKSIAERQSLSETYLEQLISPLKKAGFVKSIRGSQGGYILNRDSSEISVGDILRTLEGDMSPVECVSNTESETNCCSMGSCSNCVTKPVWEKLNDSVNNVIDNIMLIELVNDYKGVVENDSQNIL